MDPETARLVRDSGGLIGVILAQHQLGATKTEADSERIITNHLKAIERACGGLDCCAVGTDLDGFIKPTLTGIDTAADFRALAMWVEAAFPGQADRILHGNAEALVRRVLQAR